MRYDTIVIGVGAAGATAASELARAGRRVLALEAQSRVGGRVCTVPFADGVVELGAEWIHGQFPSRVYDLAVQNKVPLRVQEMTVDLYRSDGSTADNELFAELIDYCLEAMEQGSDIEESLGEVIERKFKAYLTEKYPEVLKNKELVESFLDFVNLLVCNHEASNDWRDVSARSDYEPLPGAQHASWHRYGYTTFLEILLNTYNNGPGLPTLDVKLNKEVINIQWPHQMRGSVVVTCQDGDQYTATNVIVTVSLGVLKDRYSSLFTPGLPADKIAAIDNICIGVMNKIIVSFKEEWWSKNSTFFGFLWREEDKRRLSKDDYWVTRIFGASNPLGTGKTLTLWTSGEVGKMVEKLPEDIVQKKVVELLQRFVGGKVTVPQPTAMLRSTWYSNPFTRGSYSYDAVSATQRADSRLALRAPLTDAGGAPCVLFAGEATDSYHFSTVHGASDSGHREARRLLPTSKM